jgi:hypothetical protein
MAATMEMRMVVSTVVMKVELLVRVMVVTKVELLAVMTADW